MHLGDQLREYLEARSPLAVALSGGVDSRTLTYFCALQGLPYKAYTFVGPHLTHYELDQVFAWIQKTRISHEFIHFDFSQDPDLTANTRQRCYYCKKNLFSKLRSHIPEGTTMVDATQASDLNQYRPGIKALEELGVKSPFLDLGIDREQVSLLAGQMGMTNTRNYSRSCLLTRFYYGYPLKRHEVDRVRCIDDYLLQSGIAGFRLRIFSAERIELQADPAEKENLESLLPQLDLHMRQVNLFPYKLIYMPFENISGYFDRE